MQRSNLHSYQESAVSYIKAKKKCALFIDMGLGKTVASLTAASEMLEAKEVKRVLVIAPLRVANTVWKQEAEKWEHLQHLKIDVCTGTAAFRRKAILTDADIHVINKENIPWLVENKLWRWDMVIVDESSGFKSWKSKRFRALKQTLQFLKSIVLLTGTPSPKSLIDLWSQIYLIDQGQRLGKFITHYRRNYFDPDYMGWSFTVTKKGRAQIQEKISDICLRMDASDYLELPEIIYLNRTIALPANVMEFYKNLEKRFCATFDDPDIDPIIDHIVESAAVLTNRLLQVCNGFIYTGEEFGRKLHNLKIDCLKEIIEDNPNENILVAYNYKHDLQTLRKAFPQGVVLSKEGEEVSRWNAGEIPLMFVHPQSSGHGLNLQQGGSMVVWFGLNWSLELYQQTNARVYRQGQTKPTRIIHIVAEDCMDENVLKALHDKDMSQRALLLYLRNCLKPFNRPSLADDL